MKTVWKGALAAILTLLLTACVWAMPDTLIPGGNTIGLRLQTDGVTIVEFSGAVPKKAGLRCGDRICAIDGQPVTTAQDITQAVERSEGEALTLTIRRGEEAEKTVTLAPTQTADGWRLGIFVKDSVSGIGTVTYYNAEEQTFGALGHGVNDGKSLLPIRSGSVLPSTVSAVVRGEEGAPGALQGAANGRAVCGTIEKNTPQGVFGTIQMPQAKSEAVPVASNEEIHTGAATILSNVSGTKVEEFDIRILACYPKDAADRNLLLEVTDPDLLRQTGGIVQGMSGSPILQDGKLVGAVTHVLIDDPTQGYGIFIQNMLDAA